MDSTAAAVLALMRTDKCDWADRWMLTQFLSEYEDELKDKKMIFVPGNLFDDATGAHDGRCDEEDMKIAFKAMKVPDHTADALAGIFFQEVEEGKDVDLAEHMDTFASSYEKARELEDDMNKLLGFFKYAAQLTNLGLITKEDLKTAPGRVFAKNFVKYVEPMAEARNYRKFHKRSRVSATNSFSFVRDTFDLQTKHVSERSDCSDYIHLGRPKRKAPASTASQKMKTE